MNKSMILGLVYFFLMLSTSICMFMQVVTGGGLIYFPFGVGIEPFDLGLCLPLWLAALIDAKRYSRWFAYSPLMSAAVLPAFPIEIEGRQWSDASFPDGEPMFAHFTSERVKSWDVFFWYIPLWNASFDVPPPYNRYETTDLSKRETATGNWLWGKKQTYGLNKKAGLR